MLEKPDLSPHSLMAVKLRLAEKEILERAESSGRAKRLHFQKQLDDGVPLPVYEESDISLLENADAKLPIVLSQLPEEDEEVEEEERHGEASLLNGDGKEGEKEKSKWKKKSKRGKVTVDDGDDSSHRTDGVKDGEE